MDQGLPRAAIKNACAPCMRPGSALLLLAPYLSNITLACLAGAHGVRAPCTCRDCFVGWWAWRQHALMQKEKELVAHTGISAPEFILKVRGRERRNTQRSRAELLSQGLDGNYRIHHLTSL